MTESKNGNEWFDTLARILLRCFVLGYAVVILWFVVYMVASDLLHNLVDRWFHITAHEAGVINYCGMAATKVLVLVFFLCPYIAIRLVVKRGA